MASSGESESNYAVFRECVSSVIIARSNQHKPSKAPKRRLNRSKKAKKECSAESSTDGLKSSNTAGDGNLEELADYIDVRHLHFARYIYQDKYSQYFCILTQI